MSTLISLGTETLVNTTTAQQQSLSSVAALSGGGYVVTWQSSNQDGSSYGVYAQRFDANGVAAGSETRVNTATANSQDQASVIGLADGGYVVTWQSYGQDGSSLGIYFQQFDASGAPVGVETKANTTTASDQYDSAITALADGGFIVTWTSVDGNSRNNDIFHQRYDSSGLPVGGETRVNTTASNEQYSSAVAGLPDGGYVVAWTSRDQDGSRDGIYAQRYDAEGDAVGGEVLVNTTTQEGQYSPSVAALADGGYVVTWQSYDPQLNRDKIFAQRYDSNGDPVGTETWINSHRTTYGGSPAATSLPDGGYVITWFDGGGAGGIFAQIFDAAGNRFGQEFLVNAGIENTHQEPAVTALADGRLVFTFTAYPDGVDPNSSGGIFSRIVSTGPFTGPLTTATQIVVGTGADEIFTANPDALGIGDGVDGGAGADAVTLLAPGTLDFTKPTFFAGVETVNGSSGDDTLIFDARSLTDVQTIAGGNGFDTLQFPQFFGDLSGKTLTGIEALVSSGGTLVVDGEDIEAVQQIEVNQLYMASAGTVDFGKLTGTYNVNGSQGDDTFLAGNYTLGSLYINGGAGTDFVSLDRSAKPNPSPLISPTPPCRATSATGPLSRAWSGSSFTPDPARIGSPAATSPTSSPAATEPTSFPAGAARTG